MQLTVMQHSSLPLLHGSKAQVFPVVITTTTTTTTTTTDKLTLCLHSTPTSAEVKECVELYFHSPNTHSCRGA